MAVKPSLSQVFLEKVPHSFILENQKRKMKTNKPLRRSTFDFAALISPFVAVA